jgi:Glycosyl transferase family 2
MRGPTILLLVTRNARGRVLNAMQTDLGIIITNRDRPDPLNACLRSLAAQVARPAWVAIADLGSSDDGAAALEEIADCFMISYLQIPYFDQWNQALAFNTALRHMPAVRHVIQLDADFILHPYLLQFTQQALATVDAMCCVPSYVDVREVPAEYDGSASSFGRLLSKAYGGNRLSRGGYVVAPRDWLITNRAFDEAYAGWGFEDADLWWRAEQQLTTYEEISGSLVIHQSHARQPGATDLSGNPNYVRFQQRLAGVPLPVNPLGFGGAPVGRKVVRKGICSLPERPGSSDAMPSYRPRTRQGERLKPAPAVHERAPNEIEPAQVVEFPWTDSLRDRPSISVVVVLDGGLGYAVALSMDSLSAQTVLPHEVLLLGHAGPEDVSALCSDYARRFARFEYVGAADADLSQGTMADDAPVGGDRQPGYRFVMSGGFILHPRMLEILCSLEQTEPCVLQGPVHVLPPLAAELSLLRAVPWEAWSSIAHLESEAMGSWHFFPRSLAIDSNLDYKFSTARCTGNEAGNRTEQFFPNSVKQLPADVVLCLCCPRKVDLPGIYS